MSEAPRRIPGRYVSISAVDATDDEVRRVDWLRSLHPAMAGPVNRGETGLTHLVRSVETGDVVGLLDGTPMTGYPGVINVSIFAEPGARRGWALEAYVRFVQALFASGGRLVHHEVLAFNAPVLRIMRALGIARTATLREHAYASGRRWDVHVYAYGEDHLREILERIIPAGGRLLEREAADRAGATEPPLGP